MELKKNFSMNDLKNGMIVETRNGTLLLVLNNNLINNENWVSLNHYYDDLTRIFEDSYRDIMKVYITDKEQTLNDMFKNKKLIWSRNYYKKMTITDIEKELGYKIRIMKEGE